MQFLRAGVIFYTYYCITFLFVLNNIQSTEKHNNIYSKALQKLIKL